MAYFNLTQILFWGVLLFLIPVLVFLVWERMVPFNHEDVGVHISGGVMVGVPANNWWISGQKYPGIFNNCEKKQVLH